MGTLVLDSCGNLPKLVRFATVVLGKFYSPLI
jgi:hypothetical protein